MRLAEVMVRMEIFHASKSAFVGCSHEKVRELCPGEVEKMAGSTVIPSAHRMSASECTQWNRRTLFSLSSATPLYPCSINSSTRGLSPCRVGVRRYLGSSAICTLYSDEYCQRTLNHECEARWPSFS